MTDHHKKHQPVLLVEVLTVLAPARGESYLDLTAGYGGHAREVLARTNGPAVLVDRDAMAVGQLKQFADSHIEIRHEDFLSAAQELFREGRTFDLILADLGVSSPHLDIASRGFSIQQDGPLDMRMDNRQTLSALNIVNETSQADLASLIATYGEERRASAIARAIVTKRPITTTSQLAQVIAGAMRGPRSKTHPATKTFQAIRIAVNDELTQIERTLPLLLKLLKPGGRVVIISFHSLEDRLVKQFFADHTGNRYDAEAKLLTKRPITARHHELVSNPRARSAKLRAAAKINIKTDLSQDESGKKKG